jgi:hypothetical protein
LDEDIYQKEVGFAMEMIAKAPGNESPWNYLQGYRSDANLLEYSQ